MEITKMGGMSVPMNTSCECAEHKGIVLDEGAAKSPPANVFPC